MSQKASVKEVVNTVAVTDSKVACCLHSLGFIDWKADSVQRENESFMDVTFLFKPNCHRPELAGQVHLNHAKALKTGMLEAAQPMHPLCVTMRGQNNHDMLAEAANTGRALRLLGVAGGRMTKYVWGMLDPAFLAPGVETVPVDDLDLAAALGGVGLPVVRITGAYPHFVFHVARIGYALQPPPPEPGQPEKPLIIEDAVHLTRRSPTAQDPLCLTIELENPLHPVALMYEALYARAMMKKDLERVTPLLLIGGGEKLQALVTMNATGRVMEAVTEHRKAPRLDWKK